MKERTARIVASLLIAALALAGCTQEDDKIVAQPKESTVVDRGTVASPPARTAASGEAMVRMFLPTGNSSTSVLSLEKTAPREVLVGKPFSYTIRLTNLTATALKGVVLTGKLSKNVKLTGMAPKGTVEGSHAKWNVGVLGPKKTKTFVMQGSAKATGALIGCSEVTFDIPEVCLSIRAVQPALKIRKIAPSRVLLCENIISKIVVTNTGTGPATNVRVQDNLPKGVTTLDGKTAAAFDFGNIPPGKAREVTIRTKASKTGKFTNKATVAADGGLTAETSATTTVTVPQLTVDVAGPKKRFAGRTSTYTITVANKGDADARDTVLLGTVPAGTTLVSVSDKPTSAAGRLSWKLGTIKAGASRKVTMKLKMIEQGAVRVAMAATAYCSKASGLAVTSVKGIPAILLECVDLEDPIEVGAKETYVITVTNQGTAVGTNIVIKCTLPAEQEFVSATAVTKETVKGKTVTFAPLKTLAPKAKTTYRIVVKGVKAGDVRFRVSLTSDQMRSPAGETESTHIYSDDE
ncbi:MAG: DUF11 domain-containing protein [bacterium]|nr:DUF11 domain-containing protein [bacterium]